MDLSHADVELYFDLLKAEGKISSGWKYVGFAKREKKIKIMYSHKTQKPGLEYKTSTYMVDRSFVVTKLRDHKLDDLFG